MPGYVIHLAIGYQYMKYNKINNKEQFLKGILEPDLLNTNKTISHYGNSSKDSGYDIYLESNTIDDEHNKGYFLHLLTDYLFYNKFLDILSKEVYNDYDKLNKFLIERYDVEIPLEVIDTIGYKEGETEIINKNCICNFIDEISKIDLSQCRSIKKYVNDFLIKNINNK